MNLQGALNFDGPLVTDPLRERSSYRPIRTRSKRVRDISRQNNNRLRDEAKADREAGRETKAQQVHRCLVACALKYGIWPTRWELCYYMAERHEIKSPNINLVAPRISDGLNGESRRLKDGTKVRVGGGLYEELPLRTCRIMGDDANPVKVREVGSVPR